MPVTTRRSGSPAFAGLLLSGVAALAAAKGLDGQAHLPIADGDGLQRAGDIARAPGGGMVVSRGEGSVSILPGFGKAELVALAADGTVRWRRGLLSRNGSAPLLAHADNGLLVAYAWSDPGGRSLHLIDDDGHTVLRQSMPDLVALRRVGGRLLGLGRRVPGDGGHHVPVLVEIDSGGVAEVRELAAHAAPDVYLAAAFEGDGGGLVLQLTENYRHDSGAMATRHRLVTMGADGAFGPALAPPPLPPPFGEALLGDVQIRDGLLLLAGEYWQSPGGPPLPYAAAMSVDGTPRWARGTRPAASLGVRWAQGEIVGGRWQVAGDSLTTPSCVARMSFALADGAPDDGDCAVLASGEFPTGFALSADGALRVIGYALPAPGSHRFWEWRRDAQGAIARRDAPLGTVDALRYDDDGGDRLLFQNQRRTAPSSSEAQVEVGQTRFGGALEFTTPLGPQHRPQRLPIVVTGGGVHRVLLAGSAASDGYELATLSADLAELARESFGPAGAPAHELKEAALAPDGTLYAWGGSNVEGNLVAHEANAAERWTLVLPPLGRVKGLAPRLHATAAGVRLLPGHLSASRCTLLEAAAGALTRDEVLREGAAPLALLRDDAGRARALCTDDAQVFVYDVEARPALALGSFLCVGAQGGAAAYDGEGALYVARTSVCRRAADGALATAPSPGGTLRVLRARAQGVDSAWSRAEGIALVRHDAALVARLRVIPRLASGTPIDVLALGPERELLYAESPTAQGEDYGIAWRDADGRLAWQQRFGAGSALPPGSTLALGGFDADGRPVVPALARRGFGGPDAVIARFDPVDPGHVFAAGFEPRD